MRFESSILYYFSPCLIFEKIDLLTGKIKLVNIAKHFYLIRIECFFENSATTEDEILASQHVDRIIGSINDRIQSKYDM